MVDRALAASGPIEALAAAAKAVPDADLRLLPPMTRLSFRGREAAIGPAGEAFGMVLPRMACRFSAEGGRSALWLGPDEWLLLASDMSGAALFAAIEARLRDVPHALVDVSSRSVGIEIAGPQATFILNEGCPLDLDPPAFPVGMCTRTLFAKSEIVLMRTGAEIFRIDVWRSFAAYVWQLLEEARSEFA